MSLLNFVEKIFKTNEKKDSVLGNNSILDKKELATVLYQAKKVSRRPERILEDRFAENFEFILNIYKKNIDELFSNAILENKLFKEAKNIEVVLKENEIEYIYCDPEIIKSIVSYLSYFFIRQSKQNSSVSISIIQEDLNYLKVNFKANEPFVESHISEDINVNLKQIESLCGFHNGILQFNLEETYPSAFFKIPSRKESYKASQLKEIEVEQPQEINEQEIIEEPRININSVISENDETDSNAEKSTILIVDDIAEIRKYINIHLSDFFTIIECESYFEAVETLKTKQVDLILCDLYMPEKSGIDLLLYVKKDQVYKDLPFVILTGNNLDKQQVLALKYGVDDFLEKPIHMEVLTWRLKNILNARIISKNYQSGKKMAAFVEISEDEKFLNEIVEIIENNLGNSNLNVDFVADQIGMSRATFYRKFESILKTSPSVFIRTYLLKRGAIMLKNSGKNISQIAYALGYTNPKYFTRAFTKEFGLSPKEYINTEKS